MPSWQSRFISAWIRLILRRRSWGASEKAVAGRARRLLGTPKLFQLLRTYGVRKTPVITNGVRGEWLEVNAPDAGTILYIHGGGYVSCSIETHRPITAALARLSRMRVFSLDYRLAPEHRYPAALDDAVASYKWLLSEGISPKSISFAGDSAGGGLLLGTLLRLRDEGETLPACAVCFSPWTDMEGRGESVRFNDGRCAMFHQENIAQFAAAYLGGQSPASYASPIDADPSGLPPLLFQVSSTELLLDDSREMNERVNGVCGASRVEVFDDVFHCWQMLDGVVPEARIALAQAAAFIREHSSPPAD